MARAGIEPRVKQPGPCSILLPSWSHLTTKHSYVLLLLLWERCYVCMIRESDRTAEKVQLLFFS